MMIMYSPIRISAIAKLPIMVFWTLDVCFFLSRSRTKRTTPLPPKANNPITHPAILKAQFG